MVRELVQPAGCASSEAANGAEALQVLTSTRPCLVVVDLQMPMMDGGQLIQAMKNDPALSGIPVVVATSRQSVGGHRREAPARAHHGGDDHEQLVRVDGLHEVHVEPRS
jgi:CheY-like chemotaxis protein